MKSNIVQMDLSGKLNPNGKWWSWHATCDRCGADCHNDYMMMQKPDTTENDYCVNCMRELLKERQKQHESSHKNET